MEAAGAQAYLVNTGWNGRGKRISIKDTRGIIDAILDGSIDQAEFQTIPYFNFSVPVTLPGVDPGILDPRETYENPKIWDEKAIKLAKLFVENFESYADNEQGQALLSGGPQLP